MTRARRQVHAALRGALKHEVPLCSAPVEGPPDVWAMPAFTRPYNAAHLAKRGRHPLILDALPSWPVHDHSLCP